MVVKQAPKVHTWKLNMNRMPLLPETYQHKLNNNALTQEPDSNEQGL